MTLVMGVLNVTPDSFSDGGHWLDPGTAIARGLELFREGADLVDVGGESTRPGASAVDEREELRRVLPVVEELARHGRVSIDTRKRAVAEAALAAGASFLNDESASLWQVAAGAGRPVGYCAMHMKGTPETMVREALYDDVVAEVREFLVERAARAASAGVGEVWIDPGLGFAKTFAHNWTILHHLAAFVDTGHPVLVGASRKRFLQEATGAAGPGDVLEASVAAAVVAAASGAGMVRVHDVAATVQAMRVVGGRAA